MNKIKILFIGSVFFLNSCSSSDENSSVDPEPSIVDTPFKEGTIEMGIFSNDIDLGQLIHKIDFSRTDVKQQFEDLAKNDTDVKEVLNVIQNVGAQNPLATLAMTLNIAECTYNLKGDVVLGRATGIGWTMDNYHDKAQDKGSLYLETLVQTDQIAVHDKKLYSSYKPLTDLGAGSMNDLDLSMYNRQIQNSKQNILGYDCDVITYTPKSTDSNVPVQLQKLVVYTSSLFSNTINFTHPYYLEEQGGILRLDIYFGNANTPTLVMKPKEIKSKILSDQDLSSRTASPVYSYSDANWAFKALAIMMSGWGVLGE